MQQLKPTNQQLRQGYTNLVLEQAVFNADYSNKIFFGD